MKFEDDFSQRMLLSSLLRQPRAAIGQRMIDAEIAQGFEVVKTAPWLQVEDWDQWTIITRDRDRVRLVALSATQPGRGALHRLLANIEAADLIPVIVEPLGLMEGWCKRHGWKRRSTGKGAYRHTVWVRRPR